MRLAFLNYDDDHHKASIFGTFCHWPAFVLWALMRCCKLKMYAPKIMYLYALIWVLVTNLSMRDWLFDWMLENDKKADEDSILNTIIIVHVLNYNSFLQTVCLFPPLFIAGYYF